MKKNFNIVISGTGGQGLITLTQIIAEAVLIEGKDVKTSELHGLSQRGGSVETHIKFGDRVFSPLVALGSADLILSLEASESLRVLAYAGENTKFLVNKFALSYPGSLSEQDIIAKLKRLIKSPEIITASQICRKELGKEIVAGIYLLSYACHKKIIPLKSSSVLRGIEKTVPKRYFELNKKAFDLAERS